MEELSQTEPNYLIAANTGKDIPLKVTARYIDLAGVKSMRTLNVLLDLLMERCWHVSWYDDHQELQYVLLTTRQLRQGYVFDKEAYKEKQIEVMRKDIDELKEMVNTLINKS